MDYWENVGYTTSEDEAIRVCAEHNKTVERADKCWDYEYVPHLQSYGENIVFLYSAFFNIWGQSRKYVLSSCELLDYYVKDSETENSVSVNINENDEYVHVKAEINERNMDIAKNVIKNKLLEYANKNNFNIVI